MTESIPLLSDPAMATAAARCSGVREELVKAELVDELRYQCEQLGYVELLQDLAHEVEI